MVKTRRTLKKGGMFGFDQGNPQQRTWSSYLGFSQESPPMGGPGYGGKKKRGGFRANTQNSLASSASSVSGMSSPKASYIGGRRRTRRRKGRKSRRH